MNIVVKILFGDPVFLSVEEDKEVLIYNKLYKLNPIQYPLGKLVF